MGSAERETLVHVIRDQYANLDKGELVEQNLLSLSQPYVFTVTTGHQLNILTGPLFFIYKLASAVALSRKLNEQEGERQFVPVYWMASEDHDKEEISSVEIQGERITWNTDQKGPVGEFDTSGIAETIESFRELQSHVRGMEAVAEMLLSAYEVGNLAEATRRLVHELFGEYGLIVIDARDPRLKRMFIPAMEAELKEHIAEDEVSRASKILESLGHKAQVNARPVNLFYMEKGLRERIVPEPFGYSVHGTDLRFSEGEMMELLHSHPERFSPNVLMRPLYQETILPNVAYIGGPGELSYWLQLKPLFDRLQVPFPALIERDHALLLNRQAMRLIDKLGFTPDDLLMDQTSAIRTWSERNHPLDFDQQREALAGLWDEIKSKSEEVDATLVAMVEGEKQRQLKALENVESKIAKAIRKREEDSVRQIETLWSRLYPGGSPQERVMNYFTFAADLDNDLLADIIESFNPLEARLRIIVLEGEGFSGRQIADNP
ncbi:MAG: hypothetical protein RL220_1972, partial [Bacteroidota bacterium]